MARSELAMFALRWQCLCVLSAMRVDQRMGQGKNFASGQKSPEGSREELEHLDLENKPRILGVSECKSLKEWTWG